MKWVVIADHDAVEFPAGVYRLAAILDLYAHRGRQRQYPAGGERIDEGHATLDGERVIGRLQVCLVDRGQPLEPGGHRILGRHGLRNDAAILGPAQEFDCRFPSWPHQFIPPSGLAKR